MAEDESPIIKGAKSIYTALDNFANWKPGKKKDTSWHAKMVAKANDSFRKPEPKKKGTQTKKRVGGK